VHLRHSPPFRSTTISLFVAFGKGVCSSCFLCDVFSWLFLRSDRCDCGDVVFCLPCNAAPAFFPHKCDLITWFRNRLIVFDDKVLFKKFAEIVSGGSLCDNCAHPHRTSLFFFLFGFGFPDEIEAATVRAIDGAHCGCSPSQFFFRFAIPHPGFHEPARVTRIDVMIATFCGSIHTSDRFFSTRRLALCAGKSCTPELRRPHVFKRAITQGLSGWKPKRRDRDSLSPSPLNSFDCVPLVLSAPGLATHRNIFAVRRPGWVNSHVFGKRSCP